MRALSLAKVAAQAEGLRLRELAARQGRRAAFGFVAVFFLVAVLVAAHIALGMALVPTLTPVEAVLVVGLIDLIVVIVCGILAASSKPGLVEREALEVRQRARLELQEAITVPALLGSAARTIGVRNLFRVAVPVVTGRVFRRRRS